MRTTPVAVTFVSSHAGDGGSERYLERLMAGLGTGWVRSLIVLAEGPFVTRLRAGGHDPTVLPTAAGAGSMVLTALRLRRHLRRDQPQVVHANGVKAALVAALATVATPFPVVWLKHDLSWDGALAGLLARRCRLVVGVSATVLDALGAAGSTKVVPTGVAVGRIDRVAARAKLLGLLGAPPACRVITLVGRLDPMKGHRELLALVPRLTARRAGIRVAFIGPDDPAVPFYAGELRREAAVLGDTVSFLGQREDALELLAGSDVVVVPSIPDSRGMGREGFGLVAVEAMAVGTPVVAYGDGAVPEVVGEAGLLVAPGDREALADALLAVLEDEVLRDDLVVRGRERAVDRYSEAPWLAAMRSVYAEAGTQCVDSPGGRRYGRPVTTPTAADGADPTGPAAGADELSLADRERQFYNEKGQSYTLLRRLILRSIGEFGRYDDIHEFYDVKDKIVLDYGCGAGEGAVGMLHRGAKHVTGIDISDGEIAQAVARAESLGLTDQLHFTTADAHHTGFPDHSFDLVVGGSILHHLDLEPALRELRRILRPGGTAVFAEPMAHNPLLRLGRALTPSARTPDEHPLTEDDWNIFRAVFPDFEHHERELVTVPLMPLNLLVPRSWQRPLARRVNGFDDAVLARFPSLRKYARLSLVVLR